MGELSQTRSRTRIRIRTKFPDGWKSFSSVVLSSPPSSRCLLEKTFSTSHHDNLVSTKVQFLRTLFDRPNQCEPVETGRYRYNRIYGGFRQRCHGRPSIHPVHNHPRRSWHFLCFWNLRRLGASNLPGQHACTIQSRSGWWQLWHKQPALLPRPPAKHGFELCSVRSLGKHGARPS